MAAQGKMVFNRYGRSCHLRIETADDLERGERLDEAHWAAINAPLASINCDRTFLELVDADNNSRIICWEMKTAIRWLFDLLRDTSGVTGRSETLRLAAVNTDLDEGRRIHSAARKVLARLGTGDAEEISLDQVRRIKGQAESTAVSEAGVVLPEADDDDQVRRFIADAIAATGGTEHPGGDKGINRDQLDAFLAAAAEWLQWHRRGQIPDGAVKTDIMLLGGDTTAAWAALEAVRAKLDQYFAQCEALALDERFVQRMGWTDEELAGLDFDDPEVIEKVLAQAPLAPARADRTLRFDDQINPRYAAAAESFRREVAAPVLEGDAQTLTAAQWRQIKLAFAPHRDWVAAEPGAAIGRLGPEKLETYLDERFAEAVGALIAHSAETAFDLNNIRLVEKLILYQARLMDLANNFVSFPHLYDADRRAMFEMGSLVMDNRRFNLAVRVENRPEHAKIAKTSNMYVLYAEITPGPGAGEKYEVAVPVTAGSKGNLCVGKRGLFRDIGGRECDARVVQIIENPISVREALASPFVRLGGLLTGKIESLTAQAEKKLDVSATAAVGPVAAKPAAPAAPQAGGMGSGGMLMGIGIATAALGSALAYITKTLADTSWLAIVIGVAAAVFVVMLPTSIVAFLKLRRRDLSAILEGSGWGINARMRLTRRLCRLFTQRPRYPEGSTGHRPVSSRIVPVLILAAIIAAIVVATAYLVSRAT